MAEIGIVASIIGVAGAGFRLSILLNAISCEVANAPLEISHISKAVTLFSLMLKQTGNVLKAANSVRSQEVVEAAEEVARESERVFREINGMLDRCQTKKADGSFAPTIQQRFKWCFKKARVGYLLAQLESLKLSLSLMLQIIQLGELMAATSKSDSPEEVQVKTMAIQQERAEARNVVIVRHIQNEEVNRLFQALEVESPQSPLELPCSPSSETTSMLTIEAPPEYQSSTALTKLPLHSLGELDRILEQLRNSREDMIRLSDQAIDPLLEKWTRWYEVREERHARRASGRFVPKVDHLFEDEEDIPFHERYADREESPQGYYLEGATTNWRHPHSVAARQEAIRRRKQYTNYQASVSAPSSDVEASPGSNTSSKRRTTRYAINSSSDSSGSEKEKTRPRKDSGVATQDSKIRLQESVPISRLTTRNGQPTSRMPSSPTNVNGQFGISPTSSYQNTYLPQHRPFVTPDQQTQHHSLSTPLPPIYTHQPPNQNPNPNPLPPSGYHQNQHYGQLSPQSSWQQQSNRGPPYPISRDGRRSPSRLSRESTREFRPKSRERRNSRERRSSRERLPPREEKKSSKEKAKNLRDGAAKGLLSAGAIAGFLEALQGFDL